MSIYVVYKTIYCGNRLPPYYIGSSSLEKIENGYLGSVSSNEYKNIWEDEIKINPHLFSITILEEYNNRKSALLGELEYQIKYDVVKSPMYCNKSFAIPNGFFGMDVSGEKNPMYGSVRKGEKHKGGENISSALKEMYKNDRGKEIRINASNRWIENNPTKDPKIMSKIKDTWKKINAALVRIMECMVNQERCLEKNYIIMVLKRKRFMKVNNLMVGKKGVINEISCL